MSSLPWNLAGPAVRIGASDVVLDLGPHAIVGVTGVRDQIGIVVESGRRNVTVENGFIVGMQVGIRAPGVDRLLVRNVGLRDIAWLGVHMNGDHPAVVASRFTNIGNADDGGEGDVYAVGILAGGAHLRIEQNDFHNVLPQPGSTSLTGEGVAILLSEGTVDVQIARNVISAEEGKAFRTIGVWARASDVALEGNLFENLERPVEGAYEGTTQVIDNRFRMSRQASAAVPGGGSSRATAFALKTSSQIVLRDNEFRGYACPIQLFGPVDERKFQTRQNRATFPEGRRNCPGKGAWYSYLVFKTQPPARRS